MLRIQVQRPTALLSELTQVPALLPATASAAHLPVGYGCVASAAAPGATFVRPETQVQGTNGFAAKQSVIDMDPVGGVRGIPPRGWPV
jgi:hypothetical protein